MIRGHTHICNIRTGVYEMFLLSNGCEASLGMNSIRVVCMLIHVNLWETNSNRNFLKDKY